MLHQAINGWHTAAFALAATALLGSPGPGVAALVAVGRARGLAPGLRFYGSLQLGLAIAAAASAAGIASAMSAIPVLKAALSVVSTSYLLWLAWSIASAPVGGTMIERRTDHMLTTRGGFLFGVANPKAYLAFATLMGSFTLAPARLINAFIEWLICVIVMLVVDFAWLAVGALIGKVRLTAGSERRMNVGFALAIAAASGVALHG